ncbi:MAG TPA: hypothetical protein VLF66_07395, partial [Thermoanaerobaculia bacterium]|nr:hypothetical protein [Thermoanaerobaculia bacterium]
MKESHAAWLLVLVLGAQLLLLAFQVRDESGANVIERLALRVVAPVPRAVSWLSGSVGELERGLRTREELAAESGRLSRRLEELEL